MNQIGNKDYIFKGWDWTELYQYFKRTDKNPSDEKCYTYIKKKLQECSDNEHKADVMKVREFVRKVSMCQDEYASPLFKGLYKIEDDGTFLNYVVLLLKCLWT